MKTPILLRVLVLGVAINAGAGCARRHAEPVTNDYLDDKVIAARVNQLFHSQGTNQFSSIHVDVTNATVRLTGPVTTSEQKARAETLAKSVLGVQAIQNQITLEPTAR